jgi:hypothetical protein
MFRRIGLAALLLLAATPGFGYDVSAFFDAQSSTLLEGDARQTVTVLLEREFDGQGLPTDPPGACLVQVDVRAGAFSSPVPGEATPDVDYTPYRCRR